MNPQQQPTQTAPVPPTNDFLSRMDAVNHPAPAEPPKKKMSKGMIIGIVVGVVAMIGGIVGAILVMNSGKTETKPTVTQTWDDDDDGDEIDEAALARNKLRANDLVPLGTNQVKFSATLKNTGTQDFEGRLSGLIYIKKEGEWQYLTKTGHTAELTFSAGKSTILNFNLQNASSLVAGEYMFVAVYGKDAKHWFRMHGQSTYYFVVDNPDDPQIATKEDDAKNDNIYSLEIYTPLGILLKKVEGSDLSIDEQIKSFPKGLYILSINNQSGVSYIKR